MSYRAWEADFRKSGKDQQFNSYIAFRRIHIALIGLAHKMARPILRAFK